MIGTTTPALKEWASTIKALENGRPDYGDAQRRDCGGNQTF